MSWKSVSCSTGIHYAFPQLDAFSNVTKITKYEKMFKRILQIMVHWPLIGEKIQYFCKYKRKNTGYTAAIKNISLTEGFTLVMSLHFLLGHPSPGLVLVLVLPLRIQRQAHPAFIFHVISLCDVILTQQPSPVTFLQYVNKSLLVPVVFVVLCPTKIWDVSKRFFSEENVVKGCSIVL